MTSNSNQVAVTRQAENYYKNLVNGYFSDQLHLIGKHQREAEDSVLLNSPNDLVATNAMFRVQFLQALRNEMERAYVAVTEQMTRDIVDNRMLDDLCPTCGKEDVIWVDRYSNATEEMWLALVCTSCGFDESVAFDLDQVMLP